MKSKKFIMVLVLAMMMMMMFAGVTSAFATDIYEPNDDKYHSYTIYPTYDATLYSQISTSGDLDYYDFTAHASGYLTLKLTPPPGKNYDFIVWNEGNIIAYGNTAGSGAVETATIGVTQDKAYVVLIASPNFGYSSTDDYTFEGTFTPSYAPVYEPNNNSASAASINIYGGVTTVASIHYNTDIDYYKFTANSTGPLTLNLIPPGGVNYNMYINDRATGSNIGSGLLAGDSQESVTISATAGKEYTVIIHGVSSSDYSSIPYILYKN